MASLEDHQAIVRLLTQIAWAEDTLDWALFESCYTCAQPLELDLSSHLSEYKEVQKISAAEISRTSHMHLSGFDSSQHVLSNFLIDVDPNGIKASARAYCTAYHEFKRPAEEGPGFVLVRNTWNMTCVKEAGGAWKVLGIRIARNAGSDGDEHLYVLAKQKAESGKGRLALRMWKE